MRYFFLIFTYFILQSSCYAETKVMVYDEARQLFVIKDSQLAADITTLDTNETITNTNETITNHRQIGTLRGINLAGAEFAGHTLPGSYGTNYTYPTSAEFDYYQSKGFTLIRIPFRWERMQLSQFAALDKAELARMDTVIGYAAARGIKVVLDAHNGAHWYNDLIGSANCPQAAFNDFWIKMAQHFVGNDTVYGYGISNEPKQTNGTWGTIAQATINAIRTVDKTTTIIVSGDNYSAAHQWTSDTVNNLLYQLVDPNDNLVFEAHQYFDKSNIGEYKYNYDEDGAYPNRGVDRVKIFVDWLKKHNVRGFIGEYGVPADDPRWLTVLDNFLTYLDENCVEAATYWAGGPWFSYSYPLYAEPRPLTDPDRPQMSILKKHLGQIECSTK